MTRFGYKTDMKNGEECFMDDMEFKFCYYFNIIIILTLLLLSFNLLKDNKIIVLK